MIDPKSMAGVLLREHDGPQQAFDYANRKAISLLAMNNAMGLDYAHAADLIASAFLAGTDRTICDENLPHLQYR